MRLVGIAIVLAAGVGVAGAQVMDPVTGMSVPSSDPLDYALALSGQGGNAGSEMNASAVAHMEELESRPSAMPAADTTNNSSDNSVQQTWIPTVFKPTILPKSGTFKGPVTVTIQERDTHSIVYYTLDGSKPTSVSTIYSGPITVAANEKVRAMAVEQHMLDSGIATNKYKVKKP